VKKETIIVGVICLVVGFLGGYIYQAQTSFREAQRQVAGSPHAHEEAASGGAEASAPSGGMGQRLPEGHPPVDISAVVKTLEEQAAQNPRDPEPRLKLANYLYDQQQWQRAIEWYQKALELDPKNVNARTDMGTAYFNLGRPADALREYRQSLEIDPTHQPTMFNLIVLHLDGLHDVAAAQQAWDRLHKRNPSYPGLDNLKGRLDSARASGTPVRR
jgi:tetratricopeptide (TPR) repeat protein